MTLSLADLARLIMSFQLTAAHAPLDSWTERHETIAEAVGAEAADEREVAVILTIWFNESGYREDVHNGSRRGDKGRAWCLGQIHRHPDFAPRPGRLVGADYASTTFCARATIRIYRHHAARCGERRAFSAYMLGRCVSLTAGDKRFRSADHWLREARQWLTTHGR